MQDLYSKNADFRRYVEKYRITYHLTVEEALSHALVQEYGLVCKQQAQEQAATRSTHTPMGECV